MSAADGKVKISIDIDKEDKEWIEETLPGVSKTWLISTLIKEYRATNLKPDYISALKVAATRLGRKQFKMVDPGDFSTVGSDSFPHYLNSNAKRNNDKSK